MKTGDLCRIKHCEMMPEIEGKHAEIVYLQIQEFEKYTVYPVWVKMLSEERKGKIYGFQYEDLEVISIVPGKTDEVTTTQQMEDILGSIAKIDDIKAIETLSESLRKASQARAMKIGDLIKIKRCDPMPEVIGQDAEIIDLQIQEFEKYRVYPVWVKILSGKRRGKIYGFKYNEFEMLPEAYKSETVTDKTAGKTRSAKAKLVDHLDEILKNCPSLEDIAEIERVINEAKGKILLEPVMGFWEGKTPCWEMFRCPEAVKSECPAFKYRTVPCWQIEGTYCKLLDNGDKGDDTDICANCRVYKRWGHGEGVEIKLHGKGFDAARGELERITNLN